jgi:hypothetical protein
MLKSLWPRHDNLQMSSKGTVSSPAYIVSSGYTLGSMSGVIEGAGNLSSNKIRAKKWEILGRKTKL